MQIQQLCVEQRWETKLSVGFTAQPLISNVIIEPLLTLPLSHYEQRGIRPAANTLAPNTQWLLQIHFYLTRQEI